MDHPVVLPIRLQPSNLRPLAYRVLSKKHGLNIKSDALKALADYIGPKFGVDWKSTKSQLLMEEVAKVWKEQERGLFLDAEGLSEVIKEIEALEVKSIRSNSTASNSHISVDSILKPKAAPAPATRTDTLVDDQIQEDNDIDLGDSPREFTLTPTTSVTPPPVQYQETVDWKDYFRLVNAQDQPLYHYNPISRQFEPPRTTTSSFAGATTKANLSLFSTRYHLIKERVLRNDSFDANTYNSFTSVEAGDSSNNAISLIKNLLGRNNQRFLLLGMITQLGGDWYLQDTSDKIKLQLDQCEAQVGSYYVTGCVVLVEGIYSQSLFYVNTMAQPPAERRMESLDALGNVDFLGLHGNMRIDKELQQRLRTVERSLDHKILVLGTDIFLDDLQTLDALNKLFTRISEDIANVPVAIVFPGSFTSTPKSTSEYKQLFDSLAEILEHYPVISGNVTLIFVPGDNDQWHTPIWPKQRIPQVFVNRLSRVCRDVRFGSNPTRLSYLSQEIVIARDDLGLRLRRNCLHFPAMENSEDDDLKADTSAIDKLESLPPRISEARKILKTVLDQGHLSPFTKNLKPVAWHLDQTLSLTPLPHALIMLDTTSPQFDVTYQGCRCLNPGKFITRRKMSYMEYGLTTKKAEVKELYF